MIPLDAGCEVFWRPVTGVWRHAQAATPEAALREAERQRACGVGVLPSEFWVDGARSWVGLPDDEEET
jgi:hypothetical protein